MNQGTTSQQPTDARVFRQQPYGTLPDGREITQFTCINARRTTLKVIDYGALVVALEATDRKGKIANIALGFDKLEGYLQRHPYFGACVGRFCNRIAEGRFMLDGREYTLAKNNGENHLHGGENGFDRAVWQAEKFENPQQIGVTFSYESKDGEEGYPGNLRTTARYLLNDDNELTIEFTATTDKPTPVNLTNHSYWNLGGAQSGSILDHRIQIEADQFVAVDEGLIPTGELATVQGTPLDFTTARRIGDRINELDADPMGYDHCYVVRGEPGKLRLAARVEEPKSGRAMTVYTTQPGIQFYTGNFLDGSQASGNYDQHAGLCVETQHYPDSPNQPNFPTTILQPGAEFHQVTVLRFSAE